MINKPVLTECDLALRNESSSQLAKRGDKVIRITMRYPDLEEFSTDKDLSFSALFSSEELTVIRAGKIEFSYKQLGYTQTNVNQANLNRVRLKSTWTYVTPDQFESAKKLLLNDYINHLDKKHEQLQKSHSSICNLLAGIIK